ncbi:MAG: SDR family oxidoreductase [Saprospiraceae bacterium]|nr:SDR family oxidoreductase [Saprospiraceae bacterium]
MKILITGAAGFIGQKLANDLLKSDLVIDELLLADVVLPKAIPDKRVICFQSDLTIPAKIESLVSEDLDMVFHLAAVVSGHAEKDFDLGWKVNLDMTRFLLEACRRKNPQIRFVFSSTCAVYGGKLPPVIDETVAVYPQTSYGAQKAMCELMINDYSRKGYIDGRICRLPTICVRPGKANQAASSFVSGIIREPLNGELANCPVDSDTEIWISSPDTLIRNLVHAATMDASAFMDSRTVNLPGITVTVKQMIDALEKLAGSEISKFITYNQDPVVNKIVMTWPGRFSNFKSVHLGFTADDKFEDFIKQYLDTMRA